MRKAASRRPWSLGILGGLLSLLVSCQAVILGQAWRTLSVPEAPLAQPGVFCELAIAGERWHAEETAPAPRRAPAPVSPTPCSLTDERSRTADDAAQTGHEV